MGFKKKSTFGLVPSARGGASRGGRGGGRGGRGGKAYRPPGAQAYVATGDEGTHVEQRFEDATLQDEIDERLGFFKFQEGPDKLGWLINQHAVS